MARRRFETLEARQMLAIAAGNLTVVQLNNNTDAASMTVTVSENTSDFSYSATGTSEGDFAIQIGSAFTDDVAGGVLITTVRENGRVNAADTGYTGTRYTTSALSRQGTAPDLGWRVSTVDAGVDAAINEVNVNTAAAYFPVAEFAQGVVTSSTSVGVAITVPGGSPTQGILLTNAENNGTSDDRFSLSEPTGSGWNIFAHDSSATGTAFAAQPVRYVYIPYSTPTTTAVVGTVAIGATVNDVSIQSGQAANGATITKTGTATYTLTIAGYSPTSGVLVLSNHSTFTNSYKDNILSYQASGNSWVIEHRDLVNAVGAGTIAAPGQPVLQDEDINTPIFSFAFIPTVGSAPAPPVAVNDSVAINQDTPVTISVLANDSDPNGDAISIVSATQPTNGTTVVNANGTITYTPAAGFSGTTSFTYTIKDAPNTGNSTATVNVTVRANTPPVATTDALTVAYNGSNTVSVLANDTDINGGTLTLVSATGATHGQLVVNANGTVTYTATTGYFGTDTFTYVVKDDTNLNSTGTVNVTVSPPTATFQQGVNGYTGNVDTVVRNDQVDTNNGVTSPIVVDLSPTVHALTRFDNIFGAAAGQVPLDASIISAKVSFFVTNEGTALNFHRMLLPWTDTATWNTTAQAPFNSTQGLQADDVEAVATADLVSAAVTPTLNIFYDFDVTASLKEWIKDPTKNFGWAIIPPAIDNSVQWISAEGATISQRPILTVQYAGQVPPTAVIDLVSVSQNASTTIPVLANDSDINGGALTVTAATGATHGQLVVNADSTVTYTPTPGYSGPDSFTYTVKDSTNLTATGTVNVTVTLPTVSFQQGVNGYTGTFDTHVRDNATTANEGANTNALFDNLSPVSHALLRFENLFGSGAGQIPTNASISSATLRLRITNEGNGANFHRMLQAWNEDSITWDSAVGGIQRDDVEATATPDLTSVSLLTPSTVNTWVDFNVTASVAAWLANPASNFGWAIFDQGDDGVQFATSENTTADFQPKLTVVYALPSINQPPANAVPGALSVNEDTSLAFTGTNTFSISDPDAGTGAVTATISIPAGRGVLNVSGAAIAGLTVTGSGTQSVTLTGPIADINTKLASLVYVPALNVNGSTVLTIVSNDQGLTGVGGALTDTDTVTITVVPLNDAPSFAITGNPPPSVYNSGLQTVTGFATGMTAGPADESAQTLTFNLQVGATTGNLTFATPPTINAATGTLAYAVTAGTSGTAVISVTLQDTGSGSAPNVNVSAAQTFTITGDPIIVNQPPVNAVPVAVTAAEDIRFNFTGASAVSISDPDAGTANVQTNLTVGQGALRVDGTAVAGLTVTGNDTPSVLLVGPISAINAKLSTLSYLAPLDLNATTALTIVTSDNGATGQDGVKTDTDSISITVSAVNDAPSFTLTGNPPAAGFNSGLQTVPGIASNMSAGPSNESAQTLAFNLVVGATTGGLTFSTLPSIDPLTGTLTYAATAGTSGTAQVSVILQDSGSGASPNVNTSAAQSLTITVSSIIVNQPPINTVPTGVVASEDVRFSFTGPAAILVTDSDAGTAAVETKLSLPAGTGTISVDPASVSGLTIAGNNSNTLTLTGPLAAINAKLATLGYQSPLNFNSNTTLTVVTNDNGATGQDGAKSDTKLVAIVVTAVNDAPSFSALTNPPSSLTGTGLQTVSNFATGMKAGPADEAAQTLSFIVTPISTSGGLTFTVSPSIDPVTGTLTYAATAGTKGTGTFTAVLQDSGSGAAPNVNSSAASTFTINVVGSAPTITGPANNTAIRLTPTTFTFESINPAAADGSPITFNVDWDGDGTTDELVPAEFSGGFATVEVAHSFPVATTPGQPLNVRVFTTDSAGSSEITTTPVDVTVYGLVTNTDGLDDLVFGGTHMVDRVVVSMLYNGVLQIRNNNLFYKIPAELGEITGRIVIFTGDGNDTISIVGRVPYDTELHGDNGNDYIAGGMFNDILDGGAGNDRLVDGNGTNVFYGGDGNDSISGGRFDDAMYGGAGRDVLIGSFGNDTLDGGDGNDSLVGGDGDDMLFGGAGNDSLRGDRGDDVLLGQSSNDSVYGGPGRDILFGGTGADQIYGGSDDDLIVGAEVDLGNGEDARELDVETLQYMLLDWLSPLPLKATSGPSRSVLLSDRLNASTIASDYARDIIYGQTDDDWFLTHDNDIVRDLISSDLRTSLGPA